MALHVGVVRLPSAPPHVLGIVYRRGNFVPVLDLARLLGLEEHAPEAERRTQRLVVFKTRRRTLAAVVDEVLGVFDASGRSASETPAHALMTDEWLDQALTPRDGALAPPGAPTTDELAEQEAT